MMKKCCKVFFFCLFALFLLKASCSIDGILSFEKSNLNESILFENGKTEEIINKHYDYSSIHLPLSLTTIEESAFEGTALKILCLPNTVEKIEDNAFANISSLKQITIPNNTVFIGEDTFKGSDQVIIIGAPESYARAWAEKKGIPFSPIDSFYAFENPGQITGNLIGRIRSPKFILDDDTLRDNDRLKQTGRLSSDINASRYMEFTAFHIQGRSPPMV